MGNKSTREKQRESMTEEEYRKFVNELGFSGDVPFGFSKWMYSPKNVSEVGDVLRLVKGKGDGGEVGMCGHVRLKVSVVSMFDDGKNSDERDKFMRSLGNVCEKNKFEKNIREFFQRGEKEEKKEQKEKEEKIVKKEKKENDEKKDNEDNNSKKYKFLVSEKILKLVEKEKDEQFGCSVERLMYFYIRKDQEEEVREEEKDLTGINVEIISRKLNFVFQLECYNISKEPKTKKLWDKFLDRSSVYFVFFDEDNQKFGEVETLVLKFIEQYMKELKKEDCKNVCNPIVVVLGFGNKVEELDGEKTMKKIVDKIGITNSVYVRLVKNLKQHELDVQCGRILEMLFLKLLAFSSSVPQILKKVLKEYHFDVVIRSVLLHRFYDFRIHVYPSELYLIGDQKQLDHVDDEYMMEEQKDDSSEKGKKKKRSKLKKKKNSVKKEIKDGKRIFRIEYSTIDNIFYSKDEKRVIIYFKKRNYRDNLLVIFSNSPDLNKFLSLIKVKSRGYFKDLDKLVPKNKLEYCFDDTFKRLCTQYGINELTSQKDRKSFFGSVVDDDEAVVAVVSSHDLNYCLRGIALKFKVFNNRFIDFKWGSGEFYRLSNWNLYKPVFMTLKFSFIKKLDLRNTGMNAETCFFLSENCSLFLEELILFNNPKIGKIGTIHLSNLIPRVSFVRLNMGNTKMGNVGAAKVIHEMVNNPNRIETLDLSDNELSNDVASNLEELIVSKNCKNLSTLIIEYNDFKPEVVENLTKVALKYKKELLYEEKEKAESSDSGDDLLG